MTRLLRKLGKAGLLLLALTEVFAQEDDRHAAPIDRGGVAEWTLDEEVPRDVFTFLRIHYTSNGRRRGWGGWGGEGRRGPYYTDAPDADLNLGFRLHEMTSLRVYPSYKELFLTDPALFDYPFIYMVEPGNLLITDEEAPILRKYLLGGGFLMLDDFWGVREGDNADEQIRKAFPDREWTQLTIEHPVFHSIFDLKQMPQIPNINVAWRGRAEGITWERPDAKEVDYRAMFDDKGRMMVIFCHNTDNGDGWEREGEDEWYFHEFGEKKAYPLMINILFYAMTH